MRSPAIGNEPAGRKKVVFSDGHFQIAITNRERHNGEHLRERAQHCATPACSFAYLEAGVEVLDALVCLDVARCEVQQVQPGEGGGAGEGHICLHTRVTKARGLGVSRTRTLVGNVFCFRPEATVSTVRRSLC